MIAAYLDPSVLIVLFPILGLLLGSFGNVLIARLPEGQSVVGRSACPKCGRVLGAFELIPVFSFMLQGGKCRGCRKKISPQYPLVEIASMIVFAAAIIFAEYHVPTALPLGVSLWMLLLIAVADARTQMIPDALTITLALAALAYQWSIGTFAYQGALIGAGFFGVQWLVSRGKWVGSGDIFLAGAIGLLLGDALGMAICLMLSYILGSFIVIALLMTSERKRADHIAFGPFLVLGTFLTLIMRDGVERFFFL